ncbi:hypothetical protein PanWU01x14_019210, partial [Parasponia andersonii]
PELIANPKTYSKCIIFGANFTSLSTVLGKNFLANKKQRLVLFSLYSQFVLLFLKPLKSSTVTSVLQNLAGCGPPFDQSTQVKLLLEFPSQNLILTNVGR